MVIVYGDVMRDDWEFATMKGYSQEVHPAHGLPVGVYSHTTSTPGGAAHVALQLAALGQDVHLFGAYGHELALEEDLEDEGVTLHRYFHDETIVKRRTVIDGVQVARLDFENRIPTYVARSIKRQLQWIVDAAPELPALLISDYNKGTVEYPIHTNCFPVFVNVKPETFASAMDVANVITLNAAEASALAGCKVGMDATPVDVFEDFLTRDDFKAIVVTHGAKGCVLYIGKEVVCCPTPYKGGTEPCGAGDTFIAAMLHRYLQVEQGEEFDSDKDRLLEAINYGQALAACATRSVGTTVVYGMYPDVAEQYAKTQ